MKRFILHIGPSKTGTSTIQKLLSAHSIEFAKNGVYYPETRPASTEGHPHLPREARAAIGEMVPATSEAHCSWGEVIKAFEASGADAALLSSEDFSDLSNEHWRWIGAQLSEYSICIVCALRDPIDVAFSSWKHSVRWGFGVGVEALEFESAWEILADLPRIKVPELCTCIEDSVPPADIRYFTLHSNMTSSELYDRFLQAAGLPIMREKKRSDIQIENTNQSISDWKTTVALKMNQALLDKFPTAITYPGNLDPICLQSRTYLLSMLDEVKDLDGFKIELPANALRKLQRLRSQIIKWAETKVIVGDITDLNKSKTEQTQTVSELAADVDVDAEAYRVAIGLLYELLIRKSRIWANDIRAANEFGASQSRSVMQLIDTIKNLQERVSDLAAALDKANNFGAAQSQEILRLLERRTP